MRRWGPVAPYIVFLILQYLSLFPASAQNTGIPSCTCTDLHTAGFLKYEQTLDGQKCIVYTNTVTKAKHCLPLDYGLKTCKAWDANVPECKNTNDRPLWCTDEWCYVDATCKSGPQGEVEQKGGLPSEWFPSSGQKYSFATCGTASYFAKHAAAAKMSAGELRSVPEDHVRSIIQTFEKESRRIMDLEAVQEGNELAQCSFLDSCECDTCKKVEGQWGSMLVDLRAVTITWNQEERGHFESESKCLGRQIQNAFRSVAQQTYNDPNRVAYMYFGMQENGAILQWPGTQWCPSSYDARFRPWYATAVSGPKDVVLTLDNSGSMAGGRWERLKGGVEKVLHTLTKYDYIGLILFSDITMTYEPSINSNPSLERGIFLRPATDELKEDMLLWLHDEARSPMGGTMFDIAFKETFRFLSASRQGRVRTSRCETAILFMTDGEDTSGFDPKKLNEMQKQVEPPAVIFTYAFGDGADIDLPKDIACTQKGVYYEVPDDEDIGRIMSKYYTYFAQGVQDTVARWVTYADAVTGVELMSACLPAYSTDEETKERTLLGAGCVDINMMIRLNLLRKKPAYPAFKADVEKRSAECASFKMPNAMLEEIRESSGSSCKPVDHTTMTYIIVGAIAGGILLAIVLFCLFAACRKRRFARAAATLRRQQQAAGAGVASNQGPGVHVASLDQGLPPLAQASGQQPIPSVAALPVGQMVGQPQGYEGNYRQSQQAMYASPYGQPVVIASAPPLPEYR